jgi:NADH:ubiquinone oxidoreductase subunit 2 (subunit N)
MALYGMIAYTLHGSTQGASNLEAAVKYLVLSAVASATLLFGAALVFAETWYADYRGSRCGQRFLAVSDRPHHGPRRPGL